MAKKLSRRSLLCRVAAGRGGRGRLPGLATRASAGGHARPPAHRPRRDDRRRGARARRPRRLDALLVPPPALPHKPGRVREYTLTAVDRRIEVAQGVFFEAWTYNGTVPGPVIRATEDDLLRVNFVNGGSHPHTIHFHGIHPANMDGVFEVVQPGGAFTYEFPARPYGMQLYHCHSTPLKKHIHKGLYGAFIIDPPEPRPPRAGARDGDERLRHGRRRREQLLLRQRARVLLREVPDQGQPRSSSSASTSRT